MPHRSVVNPIDNATGLGHTCFDPHTAAIMQHRPLAQSSLSVSSVILGGSVFGWSSDEAASFTVLDVATNAGLNAINTANACSRRADGHHCGENETIIGRWLRARPGMSGRGVRDAVVARHAAKPAQVAHPWVAAQRGLTGPPRHPVPHWRQIW
jgi:aryl-alcohol dehydrogenase-like predicted oxidoreductase